MRDERLLAARAYFLNAGFDIPENVIQGLFKAVNKKSTHVYEPGDFIYFGMGMGEAGHGTVIKAITNGYLVDFWYPEVGQVKDKLPNYEKGTPWKHQVGTGDVVGLSDEAHALNYWLDRSGVK